MASSMRERTTGEVARRRVVGSEAGSESDINARTNIHMGGTRMLPPFVATAGASCLRKCDDAVGRPVFVTCQPGFVTSARVLGGQARRAGVTNGSEVDAAQQGNEVGWSIGQKIGRTQIVLRR